MTRPTYAFASFPSPIAVARRRVWHVPTCPMSRDRANWSLWVSRADNLIAQRQDRKTLFHVTSYDRRNRYVAASRWTASGWLLTHGQGDIERVVDRFKQMEPPAVLVSPALVRGASLEGPACRCLLVGKVPYPDTRDPVVQARQAADADYPAQVAMTTLEQEAGRAVRGEDDWCETLCIDDDIVWFMRRYGKQYASRAFQEAWQSGGTWPQRGLPPPPALDGAWLL